MRLIGKVLLVCILTVVLQLGFWLIVGSWKAFTIGTLTCNFIDSIRPCSSVFEYAAIYALFSNFLFAVPTIVAFGISVAAVQVYSSVHRAKRITLQ